MHISFHKNNTTEASLTIKIEEADYQARVARRIKEYSKKATLKGFRPGSVPGAIVQQMYGRSVLMEEVNTLVAESLAKYLKENEIHALGELMPIPEKIEAIDWENQRDFEVGYKVGMAGPFSCKLSKNIKVTAYKISHVAEQTVDDLIEQLRRVHGKMNVVARSTSDDVIYGELRYPVQNFKTQTKIVIGEVAENVRHIFTDLGPTAEVTFEVEQVFKKGVNLPGVTEEMYAAMLRLGGLAEFKVEKIHRLSPAVLEQKFFDKVLGQETTKSAQAFQHRLKARLLQSKQEEADFRLEQSIQALLLKETSIALPDNFLKDWLQQKNSTVSKEQIEIHYQQYAKDLQWSLYMAALSKEHNLRVTHEEVEEEVQHRLQVTLRNGGVAQPLSEKNMTQLIQNFLQENNGKNYSQVYEKLYARKCINFIKRQITVLVQEVSVEEFDKLALE